MADYGKWSGVARGIQAGAPLIMEAMKGFGKTESDAGIWKELASNSKSMTPAVYKLWVEARLRGNDEALKAGRAIAAELAAKEEYSKTMKTADEVGKATKTGNTLKIAMMAMEGPTQRARVQNMLQQHGRFREAQEAAGAPPPVTRKTETKTARRHSPVLAEDERAEEALMEMHAGRQRARALTAPVPELGDEMEFGWQGVPGSPEAAMISQDRQRLRLGEELGPKPEPGKAFDLPTYEQSQTRVTETKTAYSPQELGKIAGKISVVAKREAERAEAELLAEAVRPGGEPTTPAGVKLKHRASIERAGLQIRRAGRRDQNIHRQTSRDEEKIERGLGRAFENERFRQDAELFTTGKKPDGTVANRKEVNAARRRLLRNKNVKRAMKDHKKLHNRVAKVTHGMGKIKTSELRETILDKLGAGVQDIRLKEARTRGATGMTLTAKQTSYQRAIKVIVARREKKQPDNKYHVERAKGFLRQMNPDWPEDMVNERFEEDAAFGVVEIKQKKKPRRKITGATSKSAYGEASMELIKVGVLSATQEEALRKASETNDLAGMKEIVKPYYRSSERGRKLIFKGYPKRRRPSTAKKK